MTSATTGLSWQQAPIGSPFFILDNIKNNECISSTESLPYVKNIKKLTDQHPDFLDFSSLSKEFANEKTIISVSKVADSQLTPDNLNIIETVRWNETVKYRIHKKDIVTFCLYRTHTLFLNFLIKDEKSKGRTLLSVSQDIEGYLKTEDYIPLLKLVWADKENRLEWLRKNERRLPPIFTYELALAEFIQAPTIETIQQIVFPLFNVGGLRIVLDGLCLKNSFSKLEEAPANRLEMMVEKIINGTYLQSLRVAIAKYLPSSIKQKGLDLISSEGLNESTLAMDNKIKEVCRILISDQNQFPSPTWLMYHSGQCIYALIEGHSVKQIEDLLFPPKEEQKKIQQLTIKNILKNS